MIHVWPGGFLLCLPWWWGTFRLDQNGGFSIEVCEPPDQSWPRLLGYLEFYPHYIRLFHWRCPQTPQEWRRQLRWWWMDLREEW